MVEAKRLKFNSGRKQEPKEVISGTFLGRGKHNKGASYQWTYEDDGTTKRIILRNIGTNKKFIVPRYPKSTDGHSSYGDDNLKIVQKLSNYDASEDRGFERKLKGFFLPEVYNGEGLSLGEFDLNNA